MQHYLANLNEVVRKLLQEEPTGLPMCYSLVDGSNVIYKEDNNLMLRSEIIEEASTCLPPRPTRSQVIVVWPQWRWNELVKGITDPQEKLLRFKQLARLFEPLRREGTSVYFALVQYKEEGRDPNGYVYLPNGAVQTQPWCWLPGMAEEQADHLACELDDAILTALHCEITLNNRCAIAVSGDRRVIKNQTDMNKLQTWVDKAYRTRGSNFDATTTFVKVPVSGSTWYVGSTPVGVEAQ